LALTEDTEHLKGNPMIRKAIPASAGARVTPVSAGARITPTSVGARIAPKA
jgi:hypothetical protein